MGLWISRSHHVFRNSHRVRRPGLCRRGRRVGLLAESEERLYLLDIQSDGRCPYRPGDIERRKDRLHRRPAREHVRAKCRDGSADLAGSHVEKVPKPLISGTPKLDGDRLYVPISGGEESIAAASPAFPCCKMRGSLVALDAKTGKWLWRTYTISEPAKMTGKTSTGTETWGPSGASLWTSPTIDSKLHAIYAGTGINYSQPGTKTSDSVIAFDANTGRILWSAANAPWRCL